MTPRILNALYLFAVAGRHLPLPWSHSIYILRRIRPFEIPWRFLSSYAESLALLIQEALALLIWLLIAFVSVFYRQPAPAGVWSGFQLMAPSGRSVLSAHVGRDEKRHKYIAENRLLWRNGASCRRVRVLTNGGAGL